MKRQIRIIMNLFHLTIRSIVIRQYRKIFAYYIDSPFFKINLQKLNQYKKKINDKKFYLNSLEFQVTNNCNASCIFCKKITRKRLKKMSITLFRKGVDDLMKMGGKVVSLTPLIGEPLLDPQLLQKIIYAKQKGANVRFHTNGIILDKWYKKIINSDLDNIIISTADFNKSKWEQIFGVPEYNLFIHSLSKFLQYAKEKNSRLKIVLSLRTNLLPIRILFQKDFNKQIKPYLTDNVKFEHLISFSNWSGNIRESQVKKLPFKTAIRKKYMPCNQISTAILLGNGDVKLCCNSPIESKDMIIGNITNQNLKDVYYSNTAQALRLSFFNNNIPASCKRCNSYTPSNTYYSYSFLHSKIYRKKRI